MVSEVRHRLKELRNRTGLRSRDIAGSLGMPVSTYQKYEDRRRGDYLPLAMVSKLVLALKPHGVAPGEVWALAEASEVAAFHQAWAAMTGLSSAAEQVAQPAPPASAADYRDEETGRRQHERWNPLPAKVGLNGSREICVVKDISPGGAQVFSDLAHDLEEGAEVSFELIDFGQMRAKVAHLKDNEIGLKFSQESERQIADWLAPMQELRRQSAS